MAEIAVSVVTERLASLLTEEVRLLRGFHTEVEDINRELLFIQAFLKDADAKADRGNTEMSHGVQAWVKELRETAYSIEDLLDEYLHHFANKYPHPRSGFLRNFITKVRSSCLVIPNLKPRHEIASQIKDLKLKLGKLKQESSSYGFSTSVSSFELQQAEGGSGSANPWHDPRVVSLFIDEAEIVGIESPRAQLINWLVEGAAERTVISVVGMGGIGKSTLARKVYKDKRVVERFDCRAWVTVSQSFKMEMVFRDMVKKLHESKKETVPAGMDAMDEISLIDLVKEYLRDKRYAIVFDDVWRLDFWRFFKYALPENGIGSRVVITTRNVEVGSAIKAESPFHHVHNLQPLTDKSSWELFCKKAFQGGSSCPPELLEISSDIVKTCEGLPLAIVAIGGALSTKQRNGVEWQRFHDSLGSQLQSNPHLQSITKILTLSYSDLPHYLKPCFLYLAMFPEDYPIRYGKLIRLWIAEGFVKGKKGMSVEQTAEEHLIELIHRSLVQVSHIDFVGRNRECRVHDLMREIILKKAEELSFCHVLGEEERSFTGKFRRASVQKSIADHNKVPHYVSPAAAINNDRNSQLIRSVLLFDRDAMPMFLTSAWVFTDFKLLRVLDFDDAPLHGVPEELGNLVHLKYLSLRNTKVKMLPKSIGKLQNLQTLDLKHSSVVALPVEINKLTKLRHLLAYAYEVDYQQLQGNVRGIHVERIGRMVELQKLCYVEANNINGIGGLIEELGMLRQLRKLGVVKLMEQEGPSLCASISNMKHLQSLIVYSRDDGVLNLQTISHPPKYLKTLYLGGSLSNLPDWLPLLQNLVRLCFLNSGLSYDPIQVLPGLPNLVVLILRNAYGGEFLRFTASGFQKLKVLQLSHMKGLKDLKIHEGALPVLEELVISKPSPEMEVPYGISHLKTLKSISFGGFLRKIKDSVQPECGPNYHILQHVPEVYFFHVQD